MSRRRIKMTVADLREIGEAMAWCDRNGVDGSLRYYIDLLMWNVKCGRVDPVDVDTFVGEGPWTRDEMREDAR